MPSICPLPVGTFVLTSPFGNRTSPFTNTVDFHSGLDLAAREGTPILAAGGGRLTIYAHLQEISVRRGATLRRGEELGTVGNTGWSTSPHLHYEVRVRAENDDEPVPVDPRIYILNYQWTGHEELLVRARNDNVAKRGTDGQHADPLQGDRGRAHWCRHHFSGWPMDIRRRNHLRAA